MKLYVEKVDETLVNLLRHLAVAGVTFELTAEDDTFVLDIKAVPRDPVTQRYYPYPTYPWYLVSNQTLTNKGTTYTFNTNGKYTLDDQ